MKGRFWMLGLLLACSSKPDAQTFAVNWLRALGEGQSSQAFEQLCDDAQSQLASLAARSTGESPERFLGRLAGRYSSIDGIEVDDEDASGVRLSVRTKDARLPLALKPQGSSWCVTLP